MNKRRPLIAGNWKMHKTLAEGRELVAGIREGLKRIPNASAVDVLICPPFQLLMPMAKAIDGSPIMLGAQNAHYESKGAFTGEVSVPMLKDAGCSHVIIGHSERRQLFCEDNALLAKKVRAVVAGGLTAIYCVGETLAERELDKTEYIVSEQIQSVVGADILPGQLVVAYEPVWAIGTGRTAAPQQAQEVHLLIRGLLARIYGSVQAQQVCILYGGSVKPDNAADLFAQPDVDGGLVGGACLAAGDFLAIIAAAVGLRN